MRIYENTAQTFLLELPIIRHKKSSNKYNKGLAFILYLVVEMSFSLSYCENKQIQVIRLKSLFVQFYSFSPKKILERFVSKQRNEKKGKWRELKFNYFNCWR